MVVAWTLSANPSDNYLECNGQAVDSTKYPKLYALMHNVPDYRGMFLRGLGGNSANLGIFQGDAIRNIVGQIGGPGLGRITIQGDHRPQLYIILLLLIMVFYVCILTHGEMEDYLVI